jgi:signal transduction histidine kinase
MVDARNQMMLHSKGGTGVLAVALAALLVVIGISAFAEWRSARNTQDRVLSLHDAHMQADDALDAVRSNVYLIGILTRDYLLDEASDSSGQYLRQFDMIRSETEMIFEHLKYSVPEKAQQTALELLRDEFRGYSDVTKSILAWSSEEKRSRGAEILRQRLRRREELFRLTAQVEQLVTANFERQRNQITKTDREFRFSFGWITLIALLLGFAIAGITLTRMRILQRESKAAASELRNLSGQLRTTQEQERKFLARELHDQVGQMLTGIRMDLVSVAKLHSDSSGTVSFQIARAKTNVEQTLRVIRNIAMLLRPSMLDDLGLTPALSWLVKEVSRSSGIEIESDIDPSGDSLPDAHRTCLYRIVQEALTNVSRHSEARRVLIILKAGPDWISVSVADDGRGFDLQSIKARGLGLLGMEERVRELGGSIEIQSSPGRGTRIYISLPRPQEPRAQDAEDIDRRRSRDRADRIETAT